MRTIFLLPASVFILLTRVPVTQPQDSGDVKPPGRRMKARLRMVFQAMQQGKAAFAAMLHASGARIHP